MTPLRAEPRFADGAAREDAAAVLADGRAFAAITERDPAERARRVREAVRGLEAAGARVTLTGNPLRSPLTAERLILRVGGDDLTPSALIEEAATGAFGEAGRAVLAVEQAETLDSGALEFLSALSRTLRGRGAAFQLLFAGDERLPGLLLSHGFALPPDPSAPERAAPVPAPASAERGGGRRLVLTAAGAAVLVSVATAAVLLWGRVDSAPPSQAVSAPPAPDAPQNAAREPEPAVQPQPPEPPAAQPAQPDAPAPPEPPAASLAQPPARTQAAPSAEEREAALQRDFDAFLDQQGAQTAQLTPPQRAELFKAYVAWRARRDSSTR